jgi:hypothetical protein
MRKIFYNCTSILLLTLGTLQQLQAQLIFSEPFDYPVGNLQGNGGGTGFPVGSTWSNATTAAATSIGSTANAQIVAGNIIAGYGNTGNFVRVSTEATKTSFFDRAIPLTLNDDNVTDYYLSFWYRGPGSLTTGQAAIPAQLIFLNTPNTATANDMRLGFGKSSNVGSTIVLTGFTRASGEACGAAASWPSQAGNTLTTYGTTALALPDGNGTKFILAKITKKEFTINAGSPTPTAQYFDGVRVWFLDAPPTGTTDPIFTARPNGDILTTVVGGVAPSPAPLSATDYANGIPIQSRALRPAGAVGTAPLYNSQTCATPTGGATGIRLRIEGAAGYSFDFDEIRFSIGLADILLPIKLSDFGAVQNGQTNVLNWSTVTETNNKGFYIEQSVSGGSNNWNTLGFVPGTINSTKNLNYSFTDANPSATTYYRLKQVDLDGKVTYSSIVKVKRSNKISIEISPNPVQENISIALNKGSNNNIISIVDAQGRKVSNTKFNGYKTFINIALLSKGIYFINIITENGTSVEKFVKN